MNIPHYDVVVLGSGPAGREAAQTAAAHGARALIIEQEREPGGACVKYGTIPSKTLRETAVLLSSFERRVGGIFQLEAQGDLRLTALMSRLREVVNQHELTMKTQLDLDGVDQWHGRASFSDTGLIEVVNPRGERRLVKGDAIIVATGSRPRNPPEIPIDHECVLDSDSILSLTYLPKSLAVLGGGVIASEYASIFASLGVEVTMIDRGPKPLGFLEPELIELFMRAMDDKGAKFLAGQSVRELSVDPCGEVTLETTAGETVVVEKVLCALGRSSNVEHLNLAAVGLKTTSRGLLSVDEHCLTEAPNIYAVGDVAGPPGLATSATEQGRRAVRHYLGKPIGGTFDLVPTGVYTIPEMASCGLTEAQALEKFGAATVGRASFGDTARGMIRGIKDGLLKLVADAEGRRLLGVHAVGEGAAELVTIGQLAIMTNMDLDGFATALFNFPTLAETYRIAAKEILRGQLAIVKAA